MCMKMEKDKRNVSNLDSCLLRSSVFTDTDMLLCWFGVREMVWTLLRVACSSVGMSPPNATISWSVYLGGHISVVTNVSSHLLKLFLLVGQSCCLGQ